MRRIHSEKGFTIVETLVAMLLIATAFMGLASVHMLSAKSQSLGNNLALATDLADQRIEESRRMPFDDIVTTWVVEEREGISFSVICVVSDLDMAKKLDVVVVWAERLGNRSLNLSSLVSQVTNT